MNKKTITFFFIVMNFLQILFHYYLPSEIDYGLTIVFGVISAFTFLYDENHK